MIPELVRLGPLAISPFGPAMVAAFLLAYFQLRWGFRRNGAGDDEDASSLLLAAGIWGIVGAKLYYAILYKDLRLLLDRSGLVWYGGFLLGAAAVLWTLRRRQLDGWKAADAAAPALALGYAVGRVGCFLVGDDYGRPTELPWGVAFPHGLPVPTTAGWLSEHYGVEIAAGVPADQLLPVHPTQLYETIACLVIAWLGRRWLVAGLPVGQTARRVLALLAVERFAVEFVRLKDDRFFLDMTMAQFISLGVLLLLMLWRPRSSVAEQG